MDAARQLDRARVKAFYNLLVERLGAEAWAKRKALYLALIREKESKFDIKLPVEPQLFLPPENDIDWYILASYLAYDIPQSDAAYSSTRIYPYAMAIGAVAEQLRQVPNVEDVLDKMLANNTNPEAQLFELLTASFYIKNGYEVSFIPENSIVWPDGVTKKSPDMLVKSGYLEFYVECKRAGKQTKYSKDEELAWTDIWSQLSLRMLKVAPWSTVDLTFHDQVASMTPAQVIKAVELANKAGNKKVREGAVSAQLRAVDKKALKQHYVANRVRPSCPQQELLIFGNTDSNEKRSTATIARRVVRPGTTSDVLNLFVDDVANCVGAQWRCDHKTSLATRSRHFKGLVNDGVSQIPPDKRGIVHILYETREGLKIEELRMEKNIENITAFDASQSSALGVFLHAVNYYPFKNRYEWAETAQQFTRVDDLTALHPNQSLMLSSGAGPEIEGATHWEQDQAAKGS